MTEEKLENFAKRVTDPKVIDLLWWLGVPLALIAVAYVIYRWWKSRGAK